MLRIFLALIQISTRSNMVVFQNNVFEYVTQQHSHSKQAKAALGEITKVTIT